MKKSNVTVIAILFSVLVMGLLLAAGWVYLRHWGNFGWTMGPGMMDRNFGYHMPFGGFWMLFMWLIPLAIVGVLVAGAISSIVSLARPRNTSPAALPAAPVVSGSTTAQACPNCGRVVEPDWVACPYCRASLKN